MIGFNALLMKLQEYMNAQSDPQFVMSLKKWLDPAYKRWEDEIEYKGPTKSTGLKDESIPMFL